MNFPILFFPLVKATKLCCYINSYDDYFTVLWLHLTLSSVWRTFALVNSQFCRSLQIFTINVSFPRFYVAKTSQINLEGGWLEAADMRRASVLRMLERFSFFPLLQLTIFFYRIVTFTLLCSRIFCIYWIYDSRECHKVNCLLNIFKGKQLEM